MATAFQANAFQNNAFQIAAQWAYGFIVRLVNALMTGSTMNGSTAG